MATKAFEDDFLDRVEKMGRKAYVQEGKIYFLDRQTEWRYKEIVKVMGEMIGFSEQEIIALIGDANAQFSAEVKTYNLIHFGHI